MEHVLKLVGEENETELELKISLKNLEEYALGKVLYRRPATIIPVQVRVAFYLEFYNIYICYFIGMYFTYCKVLLYGSINILFLSKRSI